MLKLASALLIAFSSERVTDAFESPIHPESIRVRGHHCGSTIRSGVIMLGATEMAASSAETIQDLKSRIDMEIKPTKRGLSASLEERTKIDSLVQSLEALCPYEEPARMPDMAGKGVVE
mmetsp:Transcript_33801/g.79665  ORF Transcript_33801/g.79665 Transcript_33801/m.79665 type:complete len:119 (-) Transcript_33801:6-362(-)